MDGLPPASQEAGGTGAGLLPTLYKRHSKLFTTSGQGKKGSVTEIRHGLAAKIGLVLECESTAKHAWLFAAGDIGPDEGYYMLFSTPERSSVLYLSDDLSELTEPATENGLFDLSSRTLAAKIVSGSRVAQVTTESTTLIHHTQRYAEIVHIADTTRANCPKVSGSYTRKFWHNLA